LNPFWNLASARFLIKSLLKIASQSVCAIHPSVMPQALWLLRFGRPLLRHIARSDFIPAVYRLDSIEASDSVILTDRR